MMTCRYDKIYVICPYNFKTGGTELLHQLVNQINVLNGRAYIVYINEKDKEISHITEKFESYINDFLTLDDIQDNNSNAVVIPETLAELTGIFHECHIYLWWLSVDNFVRYRCGIRGRINEQGLVKGMLSSVHHLLKGDLYNCINLVKNADTHLCQSYYAMDYLRKMGITDNVEYLSDYLNDEFTDNHSINISLKKNDVVLYNPSKGYSFTKKIIDSSVGIHFIPIKDMTTETAAMTMRRAKVYIDFGNHPGKDRMPREAAISGCCIITGKKGAAAYYDDVPIDDKYKFDDNKKNLQNIIKCINDCIVNYTERVRDFTEYCETIFSEKNKFINDIEAIFFEKYDEI